MTTTLFNAWWSKPFTGENNPPDCSSVDGVTGSCSEEIHKAYGVGGACGKCPKNKYGSEVKQNGDKGKGKACKNMRRIFILREGEMLPWMVAVPPTSLTAFEDYSKAITNGRNVMYGVVTKVKLSEQKSGDGIAYSELRFSKTVDLTKEERTHIKNYITGIKEFTRKVKMDENEYSSEGAASAGGSVDDTPDDDQPY